MNRQIYQPTYNGSWALVIGINAYEHAGPLEFACNDAEAVAQALVSNFDFPEGNVTLLLNADATRDAIMDSYLEFASQTGPDDRILFFFAGHGMTVWGHRGETGFLIPVDGKANSIRSLIGWDDITGKAAVIPAKHMLFVMDACYSGLAITRAHSSGSTRFLKDMLSRLSRQVITAGKADETVSDTGGPLPGHSVFTGHFLQALEGKVETSDGIIAATDVMGYVYRKVSRDYESRQTPHFGFFDGDGEFFFKFPPEDELESEDETGKDIMVEIAEPGPNDTPVYPEKDLADTIKEDLSNSSNKIRLDDRVTELIRDFKAKTTETNFPLQNEQPAPESIKERLGRYESLSRELLVVIILLAHWGDPEFNSTLRKVMARPMEIQRLGNGVRLWLAMRWYPALLLLYSGGIAAIAGDNYDNLATLFLTGAGSPSDYESPEETVWLAGEAILELNRTNAFQILPGYEKKYVPISEYLHRQLQPSLDDLLYLGTDYERVFDRFELLFNLTIADLYQKRKNHIWAPMGRYAWKYSSWRRDNQPDPFSILFDEAQSLRNDWPPLQAGLFGGSFSQFEKIATTFQEEVLDQLNWF